MNLTQTIQAIRAAWVASVGCPLSLQLAPDTAQVPYAVMRIGTISPGEDTTATKGYEFTCQFVCFLGDETEAISTLDAIDTTFHHGRISGVYSSLLVSADLDLQYTDAAALWTAEASISFRWTQEI